MTLEFTTGGVELLAQYSTLSIAFTVRSILHVELLDNGLGGMWLVEELNPHPYVKDYDALPDGKPTAWPALFDMRRWGVILASEGETLLGGAVVAFDTPGIHMLGGRGDLAVLWDIRVAQGARRRGVGRRLFRQVEEWARSRGCTQLKIETQNVNVDACRFYERMGCTLGTIDCHAYAGQPEVADEVMLLWYKKL